MALPFYTIGHSTRPLEQFVALVLSADVSLVLDMRKVPRSPRQPAIQY